MAPNVKVPTNFGRHHIGSASHSNLALKLKEGKVIRASSLILSFNSPVIEHLTTELQQTSLDMDDFQEPAVQSFIVAAYVGELEDINKDIFRDVNKMSHVFDVSWLEERCGEYFKGLCETLSGENYEDVFYLFEEAEFVLDIMKKRDLIEVLFRKISLINGKEGFVSKYMEDISNLSKKQLDLMLELAGNDVQIVVKCLTCHITEHLKVEGAIFTENSRYLLENSRLSFCRENDRSLYENLFNILQGVENISNGDLKFVLTLYRESSQENSGSMAKRSPPLHMESNQEKRRCLSVKAISTSTKIPNLFHSFDQFHNLPFMEFIDILGDSVKVRNLMMFVEGLYYWFVCNDTLSSEQMTVVCSDDFMNLIVAIMQKRKWNSVPKQYFNLFPGYDINIKQVFDKLSECDALCALDNDARCCVQLIDCYNPMEITWKRLFEHENKFMFHFKHPLCGIRSICSREGKCGFIIKTTPGNRDNPDIFDMQLCTDQSEYPADLHFHDEMLAENINIMLERYTNLEFGRTLSWCHTPISWAGNPNHDRLGRWGWGQYCYDSERAIRLKVLYNVQYRTTNDCRTLF